MSRITTSGTIFAQNVFSVFKETSPILITCILDNERQSICKKNLPVRAKTTTGRQERTRSWRRLKCLLVEHTSRLHSEPPRLSHCSADLNFFKLSRDHRLVT